MFKNLTLDISLCDSQHVFSLIMSYSIFCVLWCVTSFSVKLKKPLKFKLRALFNVTFVLLDVARKVGLTLSLASGDYTIKGTIAIAFGENHPDVNWSRQVLYNSSYCCFFLLVLFFT